MLLRLSVAAMRGATTSTACVAPLAAAASTRMYAGRPRKQWPPQKQVIVGGEFRPKGEFDWKKVRDDLLDSKTKKEIERVAAERQAKLDADADHARTLLLDDVESEPEVPSFDGFEKRIDALDDVRDDEQSRFVPVTPQHRVSQIDPVTNSTYGIGRRKTSSARVIIKPGMGQFIVNGRHMVDYFPRYSARDAVLQPFVATETLCQFDVEAVCTGGGLTGQAHAVRHALARSLERWDPNYRAALKVGDLLTRDDRMVERKKTGQPGARKKKAWSKR